MKRRVLQTIAWLILALDWSWGRHSPQNYATPTADPECEIALMLWFDPFPLAQHE